MDTEEARQPATGADGTEKVEANADPPPPYDSIPRPRLTRSTCLATPLEPPVIVVTPPLAPAEESQRESSLELTGVGW